VLCSPAELPVAAASRCGTQSLARLLSRQPNARVLHEPEIDHSLFDWCVVGPVNARVNPHVNARVAAGESNCSV
jgi:hypothetical protein